MHVLLATDARWLADDLVAALGDEETSFTVVSEGREVARQMARAAKDGAATGGSPFDLGIFDLQIGTMGGIAVTMALRLDASAGTLPSIPVIMLLDRIADVHLAKRSGANGWLIKPLDPLRIRRAVRAVLDGGSYTEGLVMPQPAVEPAVVATEVGSAGSELAPAG